MAHLHDNENVAFLHLANWFYEKIKLFLVAK